MYLIVGGSGFPGVHVVRRFVESGQPVRVFDQLRHPSLTASVEMATGDVFDVHALHTAARGATALIHAADVVTAAPELLRGVNVGGTSNALRAALDAGVARFVFLSSAEVYGNPVRLPVHEDAAKQPAGPYGANKLEAEKRCEEAARQYGLELAILRPSVLVGPEMTDRFLLLLLARLARGQAIASVGSGRNRFQLTAAEDCADACWRAATLAGVSGAFNIGSSDPLPSSIEMEQLRVRIGTRSRLWRIPRQPLLAALRGLARVHAVPLRPEQMAFLSRDFVMDTTRAQQVLGWQPRYSNVDALVQACRWLVESGQARVPS
jgi:nucleoside-diphosphate-sugar epimerase